MGNGFFQRLRDALRPVSGASKPLPENQLFIDDQVVGGLEVLPASTLEWCRHQIEQIRVFSAQHQARDSSGWSDMYVRPPAPADVASLVIPFGKSVTALAGLLRPIPEIVTGSASAPTPIARARAFGPSPLTAVVIYGDARMERVASIELSLRGSSTDQLAVLSAMSSIPSPEPLLIVDWERGTYARIGDAEEMQRFTASPALA